MKVFTFYYTPNNILFQTIICKAYSECYELCVTWTFSHEIRWSSIEFGENDVNVAQKEIKFVHNEEKYVIISSSNKLSAVQEAVT